MDPSALLQALATGALFGLSAGLSPGPLLALVIAQTLRHGAGHGVRVAMAPLITDVPIVVLCTAAVLTMTAAAPGAVALIALAGAVMVAWLARDTWRAEAPRGEAGPGTGQPPARSWSRGALVNLLSPHPWLFWLLVGSPTLLVAWTSGGPGAAAAFLAGFYGCLVGAKVAVALIVARARGRVAGRGYRLVMRGLGVLLALFAAGLAVEGVSQVRQALGA
jgi:threonine/homoserine/homoserine lactone efflux protein